MKEVKQMISKIKLVHIAIVLLSAIMLILAIYQYTSTIPKEVKIDENIAVEELPATDQALQDVNSRVKKAICAIETSKLPEKEYYNYVIGKGVGKEVDFSILFKINEKYYKIKTLQEGDEKTPKINLVGCIRTKYLNENFEMYLYDNERQKLYKYVGGTSEGEN